MVLPKITQCESKEFLILFCRSRNIHLGQLRYSTEIEQHLGLGSGAADSAFGFVSHGDCRNLSLGLSEITDKSGNEAETLSRWVEVFDITPPVMTLYGADPYFVDVNASNVFNDPGAFAIDNLDRFIDWEEFAMEAIKLSIEKLLEDDTYEPVETTIPAIMAEAKKQLSLHATFRLTTLCKMWWATNHPSRGNLYSLILHFLNLVWSCMVTELCITKSIRSSLIQVLLFTKNLAQDWNQSILVNI